MTFCMWHPKVSPHKQLCRLDCFHHFDDGTMKFLTHVQYSMSYSSVNRWHFFCTLTCRLTWLFTSSGHLGLTSKHAAPSPSSMLSFSFHPITPPRPDLFSSLNRLHPLSPHCHYFLPSSSLLVISSSLLIRGFLLLYDVSESDITERQTEFFMRNC